MKCGIGLLGYGRWGEKLARVIAQNDPLALVAVCEIDAARRECAAAQHPGIALLSRFDDILAIESIAAVAIATPPRSLAGFARRAIAGGLHAFVEKPGAMTPEEILALDARARRAGTALMIDLTPVFSSLQDELKGALARGSIGRLESWRAERINVAHAQAGIDVMRDLAIHDLGVLDHALGRSPSSIAARDVVLGSDGRVRQATMLLRYADGLVAEIVASWNGEARSRTTTITGETGRVIRDDVSGTLQIIETSPCAEGYREIGNTIFLGGVTQEPLARAIEFFVVGAAGGVVRRADGPATARLLSWIVCAEKSIAANGEFVPLLAEATA